MCRKNPHFWWIISILILIIVGLITYIQMAIVVEADAILKALSVASTWLSILLSIFAIMYTYTSNTEINRQFDRINDVAAQISSAADKLVRFEIQIQSRLDKIDNQQFDIVKGLNKGQIKSIETTNSSISHTKISDLSQE